MTPVIRCLLLLAILAPLPLGGQEEWAVRSYQMTMPTPLHTAIYQLTAECAGVEIEREPRWARAASIERDGERSPYLWDTRAETIVLDRIVWLDPLWISVGSIVDLHRGSVPDGVLGSCALVPRQVPRNRAGSV